MIAAVLDTNVLASGFVGQGPAAPVQILNAWHAGSFALIVSTHLLTELTHTFEDPYFRRRLTPQEMVNDMRLFERHARIAIVTESVSGVATHSEDDLTLAIAVSASADYLVTGDKKLQGIAAFQGYRSSVHGSFSRSLDIKRRYKAANNDGST
ncbi:MAG: putative toxin-antitoxin system toxin component, PIN family [Dehalococcoidia bacterium]|nr:putative toxin-antitoxin system toxin component, PIN family [Dehalococcoidia bacterium]